jgi:hypothetical protein
MLTTEQRQAFDAQGFVRLPGAFSRTEALAMEAQVWAVLGEKYGARRTDPETWTMQYVSGLQTLKKLSVFEAIGSTTTLEAIDDLLGKGRWKHPTNWGQFLISFPTHARWTVPTDWHTDFGFLAPTDSVFGALVFSYLSDVAPHGGGTAVLAGSHRLIRRFVNTQPHEALEKMKRARKALLRSDPWLEGLSSKAEAPDRVERFMETEHVIDGVPVRVSELTGNAGDVIIGHPWLLHTGAPNCGNLPRFMCVQRIRLADDRSGFTPDSR